MMESTFSTPPAGTLDVLAPKCDVGVAVEILEASARCIKDENESVEVAPPVGLKDMAATADSKAESAP